MFFMKIIPDPTLISKILPPIIVDNLRCVPTGTKTSGLLHAVKRHVEIYLSLSARPNWSDLVAKRAADFSRFDVDVRWPTARRMVAGLLCTDSRKCSFESSVSSPFSHAGSTVFLSLWIYCGVENPRIDCWVAWVGFGNIRHRSNEESCECDSKTNRRRGHDQNKLLGWSPHERDIALSRSVCCVLARSQVDTIGWLGLQNVRLNVVCGESSDGKLTDREPLPKSFARSGGMVVGRTRPSALPLRDTFRARRQSKNNGAVPPRSTGPSICQYYLFRWGGLRHLASFSRPPSTFPIVSRIVARGRRKEGRKEGRSTSSCAQIK